MRAPELFEHLLECLQCANIAATYGIALVKRKCKPLPKVLRDATQRIRESLDHIATDPYAQHPNVTRLQNRAGYRLRVGDWRVIYETESDELVVLVLRIGPRGGVYR